MGTRFCCLFLLFALACCGNSSDEPATSSAPDAASYCAAEGAWKTRCAATQCSLGSPCAVGQTCPAPTTEPCYDGKEKLTCDEAGTSCLARVFRAEVFASMETCERNAACDQKEECIEKATFAGAHPAADTFAQHCAARQEACKSEIQSDENFFCFDLSANTDPYIKVYEDCLAEPCRTIRGCHDKGKFTSYCAL